MTGPYGVADWWAPLTEFERRAGVVEVGTCPDSACGHAASLHQQQGCVGHHGLCRCDWRPDGGEGGSVKGGAS